MKPSKKEPKSVVWANGAFKYKTKHDGTLDKGFVVCQQCNKSMKKHSGTTNLMRHLEDKHPQVWRRILGRKAELLL